MTTPYRGLNRARFIEFCETALSDSRGNGSISFLQTLSERLCHHFDLPVYLPGQARKIGARAAFYKADVMKIVKQFQTEKFDAGAELDTYLKNL